MTILVLGGRGKTASRLSSLLYNAGIPFLVGSSSTSHVSSYKLTHFDWLDERTWSNGFKSVSSDKMDPISAIYLVGAHAPEFITPALRFIDFARDQGVRRFILLSASNVDKGTHSMGLAHAHLDSHLDVEYVLLRPTWFMGKFCRRQALS
jgi:festuclavine dehydrogenase